MCKYVVHFVNHYALNWTGWFKGNILKVIGSNLGQDTGYPELDFSLFSSAPPQEFWDSTSIRPRPLPSNWSLINPS
jgi:hypothetical protein